MLFSCNEVTVAVTVANTPANSGMAVSISTAAMTRPFGSWGVTSPYPTVEAVVTAQYRPVPTDTRSTAAKARPPATIATPASPSRT